MERRTVQDTCRSSAWMPWAVRFAGHACTVDTRSLDSKGGVWNTRKRVLRKRQRNGLSQGIAAIVGILTMTGRRAFADFTPLLPHHPSGIIEDPCQNSGLSGQPSTESIGVHNGLRRGHRRQPVEGSRGDAAGQKALLEFPGDLAKLPVATISCQPAQRS